MISYTCMRQIDVPHCARILCVLIILKILRIEHIHGRKDSFLGKDASIYSHRYH